MSAQKSRKKLTVFPTFFSYAVSSLYYSNLLTSLSTKAKKATYADVLRYINQTGNFKREVISLSIY